MLAKLPYVWDYEIDEDQFRDILAGRASMGRLDQRWAVGRLLEYAPYPEIIRLLGYRELIRNWPEWRRHVRSASRRRGLDFISEWIPRHHPGLI